MPAREGPYHQQRAEQKRKRVWQPIAAAARIS